MKRTHKTVAVAAAAGLFLSGCNSASSHIIAPEMPGKVTPSDRSCNSEHLGIPLLGGSPVADSALPALANAADRRLQQAACLKAITVANAVLSTYFDQGNDIDVFTVLREYGTYSERFIAQYKDSQDTAEVSFDIAPDRSEAAVRGVTLSYALGSASTQVIIERTGNVWHIQAESQENLVSKARYVDNSAYASSVNELDQTVNQLNTALHVTGLVPVPEV